MAIFIEIELFVFSDFVVVIAMTVLKLFEVKPKTGVVIASFVYVVDCFFSAPP